MAKVYAQLKQVDDLNLITAITSEYEDTPLDDTWTKIDEGRGAKYSYASTKYLPGPIKTNDGYYNYKYIEGTGVQQCTSDDIIKQKNASSSGGGSSKPTTGGDENYDFPLYPLADGLANKITVEEVSDEKLRSGENFTFIALFDNDSTKATTINGTVVYMQGTKNIPTFQQNCAYTVWYSEDDGCFYVKISEKVVTNTVIQEKPVLEGTATADKVLAGATFSSASGANQNGKMPENGAFIKTLACGESVVIPAGHHNGQGRVTAPSLASFTPGNLNPSNVLAGAYGWSNGQRINGQAQKGYEIITGKKNTSDLIVESGNRYYDIYINLSKELAGCDVLFFFAKNFDVNYTGSKYGTWGWGPNFPNKGFANKSHVVTRNPNKSYPEWNENNVGNIVEDLSKIPLMTDCRYNFDNNSIVVKWFAVVKR